MPEIMSGFVRMPKESSKMITQQESGEQRVEKVASEDSRQSHSVSESVHQ